MGEVSLHFAKYIFIKVNVFVHTSLYTHASISVESISKIGNAVKEHMNLKSYRY